MNQTSGSMHPESPLPSPAPGPLIPAPESLPSTTQALAQHYLSLRQRNGEILLETARCLYDARTHAQHGEWYVFLATVGTSPSTAERLLQLHTHAMLNPRFADLVRSNWLHPSVAMLLARPSTPPAILAAILDAPDPPTAAAIALQIRAATSAEDPAATSTVDTPACDPPAPRATDHSSPVTRHPLTPDQIPHIGGSAAPTDHASLSSDPSHDPLASPPASSASSAVHPSPPSSRATGEESQEVDGHSQFSVLSSPFSPTPDQIPHIGGSAAPTDPTPHVPRHSSLVTDPMSLTAEQQALLADLHQRFGSDWTIANTIRAALEEVAVTFEELGHHRDRFPRTPASKHLLRTVRLTLEALFDHVHAHLHQCPSSAAQHPQDPSISTA